MIIFFHDARMRTSIRLARKGNIYNLTLSAANWECISTWKRVLSPECSFSSCIARSTFLWPPGTKQTAPSISNTEIFARKLSVLRLRAITSTAVGWRSTRERPSCTYNKYSGVDLPAHTTDIVVQMFLHVQQIQWRRPS